MKFRKDNRVQEVTHPLHIEAFKNDGWKEVQEPNKDDKKGSKKEVQEQ